MLGAKIYQNIKGGHVPKSHATWWQKRSCQEPPPGGQNHEGFLGHRTACGNCGPTPGNIAQIAIIPIPSCRELNRALI